MLRRTRRIALSAALAAGMLLALPGCPLKFEDEPGTNAPPNTFFDRQPPFLTGGGGCGGGGGGFGPQEHTKWISFLNEVSFSWLGTDLDSDVVAFQFQLVETDSLYYATEGLRGSVLRSLDPRSESPEEQWSERVTDDFQAYQQLPDGWYEFRVRALDASAQPDDSPARSRFEVFFDDIPPAPEIRNTCGRIGSGTSKLFFVTASDLSRSGIVPRSLLEWRARLRSDSPTMCPEHAADQFTPWTCFPDDNVDNLIKLGDQPPTQYQDLFSRPCSWTFVLQVRDPSGKIGSVECPVLTTK